MAHDPFTAHVELATATRDAILACEDYFRSREGETPSPTAMAMLRSVAQLRRAHEQFGRFTGGIVEAYQRLAVAYEIAPAAVPTVIPAGAPAPWLASVPEDEHDALDDESEGEDDDGETPLRRGRVALPRADEGAFEVSAADVPLDALALAATEVVGDDGTALAVLVGRWTDAVLRGAPTLRLTTPERALLDRLAPTASAVAPLLVAIRAVGSSQPAVAAPEADVLAVLPGGVTRVAPPVGCHVLFRDAQALAFLPSLPEYRAAQAVASRETLRRIVDAIRRAVAESGRDAPLTVCLSPSAGRVFGDVIARLAATSARTTEALISGVVVTPAR
ncbi:MAG: hypothetical protein H3C62_00975 [Gemmatimonadaceae bacterium]|nr:hypothetical protein [Gemmatimonadaceae bacterium]